MSERPTPEEPQVRPRGTPEDPQSRPRGTPEAPQRLLLANAYVATLDDAGTEVDGGWVLARGAVDRGRRRRRRARGRRADRPRRRARPPGLVNTHHHLYQTLTARGRSRRTCSAGCASSTRSGHGSTPKPSTQPPAPGSPSSRSPAARPSSTTTTSSRPAGRGFSRPRCRRRRSWSASRRLAGLDGSRRVGRRAPAR